MKKYILGAIAIFILGGIGFIAAFFYFNKIIGMPTGSMANTIIPGEIILSSRNVSQINRGDIIAFKFPKDPKVIFMQRVIGLPGEVIQIRGQKVFINEKELPERRVSCTRDDQDLNAPLTEISFEGSGNYSVYIENQDGDSSVQKQMKYGVTSPLKIPDGEYFILGDARDNSMDSRYWGTVKADAMLYKAKRIIRSSDPSRNNSDLK